MSTFFKDIEEMMADRQEVRLHITKVGSDLVVLAVPNFKEEGKHITVSGSPAELDAGFIAEIKKPLQLASGKLTSNAAEVSAEMEEEAEDEDDKKPKKPAVKKQAETKKEEKKPAATKGGKKSKAQPAAIAETKQAVQTTIPETAEETEEETPAETKTEPVEVETKEPEQEETPEVEAEVEAEPEPRATPEPEKEEEEDGPDPEQLFEYFMVEGKRMFDDRKYKEAEEAFKKAVDLKPEDKKAKGELEQASKWVRAIEKLNK